MGTYTQAVSSRRGYWIRADEPQQGWWPWAWLPLIGLLALFLIGLFYLGPKIEDDVLGQVSERIQFAGVSIVESAASGQEISLKGIGDSANTDIFQVAAEGARCATWAGDLVCPTQVSLELTQPEPVVASVSAGRWHDFLVKTAGSNVVLSGEVASENDRRRWVEAAQQRFAVVSDELVVSGETGLPGDTLAQLRALESLSQMARGKSQWADGELSLEGFAPETDIGSIEATFSNPDSAPSLGKILVQPLVDAGQCNESMAQALSQSTIRFRTGSAEIDPSSQPLLDRLAKLTKPCPGQIRIEGHTDSVGDNRSNLRLSEARANAVRNALIELEISAGRLKAVGLGETQPVADNETEAGRAANRRIVITALNDGEE